MSFSLNYKINVAQNNYMTNINSFYSPLLINHLLHYLYRINSLFLLQKCPLSKKRNFIQTCKFSFFSPKQRLQIYFLSPTALYKNLHHLIHSTYILLKKTSSYCWNQNTSCSIFKSLIQLLIRFAWFNSLFNSNNILLKSLLQCYISYHLLPHHAAYLASSIITRMLPIQTTSFSMKMPIE